MTEFTTPRRLNHTVYITRDTARTVEFYKDVLGMRLISYAEAEEVPSTGDKVPFLHTFFEMGDGSCVAFFEIKDLPEEAASVVPRWARHLAMSVDSEEELLSALDHLKAKGVDVIGPVDHEGIWKSIYFFDPNDIRLELTYQNRKLKDDDSALAYKAVENWLAENGKVSR
jgi:catechol 2,3-dioxygenase-like lactoylglutathione lyase family enzyme